MGQHGQYRALVAAAALSLWAGPGWGACRLALALGFDVSRSVDVQDYAIQRDGILAALAAPEIVRALLGGDQPVRLALYEWSGQGAQAIVVDWTEISTQSDIDAISARVAAHPRSEDKLPTALGEALDFGLDLLNRSGDCPVRTLDISGDGRNNDGDAPEQVRARRDLGDILVNGLAIGGHEADIAVYYRQHLIHGKGAFVEVARQHSDFPRVFRRKLERELTEQLLGRLEPREDRG
ncbi:DUF1194 domain-containing protein [Defluviimonas sp. WL0002]|uniref:DUF1194 domain-containing protein n=1 Tax=Albidovulum marisflavi TaxID=2984159 RepID=A0ABT2ZAS0_9RHOB|nr:DUF1194 domain-containing protein [Defluviimonas sp. WL0002]MCV2868191.1 DUF1194 domain-containing protein [Defluviimonas sp. WL0002]